MSARTFWAGYWIRAAYTAAGTVAAAIAGGPWLAGTVAGLGCIVACSFAGRFREVD